MTTLRPIVTPPQYGAVPAIIQQPEEPRVSAQEGGYVTLKCIAIGNPRPIIIWRKDTTLVTYFPAQDISLLEQRDFSACIFNFARLARVSLLFRDKNMIDKCRIGAIFVFLIIFGFIIK